MIILNQYETERASRSLSPNGSAVTIGNFDGCHRGHQALVKKATDLAKQNRLTPVVMTFDPRPDDFLRQHRTPTLFTLHQKTRAFSELGVETLIVISFDQQFASLEPAAFFEKYLASLLSAKCIVVGPNFFFGRNRKGTPAVLSDLAGHFGAACHVHDAAQDQHDLISSSLIRSILYERGDVQRAASMLGHPFMLEGQIEKGAQRGRELGFPTINIHPQRQVLPASGVYAAYAYLSKKPDASVMSMSSDLPIAAVNIGKAPTLRGAAATRRVEAHLIDGSLPPFGNYGDHAAIYLMHRIRDERHFQSEDELRKAITTDIESVKRLLATQSRKTVD